ncbi:hypothetical protein [Chitinophaga silvisoli]|uniref:Uncharacterized protein n=1 Tax=Chitinophaga silvisoli TaxID=2291814 RepID=A0A3E1NTI4_9BACT|nr:hypothetical protein [Chitinophaga silvisoli]RFM31154.1 hypothetical protein DXN04_30405 [Chitinophaga silvisoli]
MKVLLLLSYLTAFSLFCTAQAPLPAKNLSIFGRGTYPGDDTTYALLQGAGFNTVLLSSFYIHADGDLYSGDDNKHPIIHDGKWVGDTAYLRRVAALKKVARIEILLEGRWYNQPPNTFDFMRDWVDATKQVPGVVTGTGEEGTLFKICKVLKEVVGADAFCIDDESVYDSHSVIEMSKIAARLKMHMTLCPFRINDFWKTVLQHTDPKVVDAIYLQCYDGGTRANPGTWKTAMGAVQPVYPIFMCRGAFSTCASSHNSKTVDEIKSEMKRFKADYPQMSGASIWQMADVKSFVKNNCAVTDPTSGTAKTVKEFLAQIKESLSTGL